MWRGDAALELAGHATTLASRYAIEPAAAADVASDLRARSSLNGGAIDLAGRRRLRAHPIQSFPLGAGVKLEYGQARRWEHLVLPPDRKGHCSS